MYFPNTCKTSARLAHRRIEALDDLLQLLHSMVESMDGRTVTASEEHLHEIPASRFNVDSDGCYSSNFEMYVHVQRSDDKLNGSKARCVVGRSHSRDIDITCTCIIEPYSHCPVTCPDARMVVTRKRSIRLLE